MPDSTKTKPSEEKTTTPKPKYKVEEVVEEPTMEEVVSVKDASEPKETTDTETPKVTSFSMVDKEKTVALETEKVEEITAPTPEVEKEEVVEKPEATIAEGAASTPSLSGTAVPDSETQGSDVSSSEIQEWLQNVRPETAPESPKERGGNVGKILAVFLVLLILGALGGGIYYYQANVADSTTPNNEIVKEEPQVGTTEETSPTVTPTPTVAAIDLSTIKVQVLNGSGTSGEAGKAQSYLEGAGFKSFKTGNASAFNFTTTEVSLKTGVSDEVFQAVKKSLENYYQDVTKSEKALADSSEFDVSITIGKKK